MISMSVVCSRSGSVVRADAISRLSQGNSLIKVERCVSSNTTTVGTTAEVTGLFIEGGKVKMQCLLLKIDCEEPSSVCALECLLVTMETGYPLTLLTNDPRLER